MGCCRYCGQTRSVDGYDQDGADEWVTLNCNCSEGWRYRTDATKLKKREKDLCEARSNIDSLFASLSRSGDCAALELLKTAAAMVYDNKLTSLTAGLTYETRAKIARNSKGNLTIERKDTTASKVEV